MGLFTKGTMRSSTNSLSTHNKATLLSTFVQRKPTVVLQKPSTSHCQRFSWSILGAIGAGVQGLLDILGKSQPGPQVRSCAPEWWALALQAPAHPAGCHLNVLVAVGQDTQDNHHLTSLSIRWSFFFVPAYGTVWLHCPPEHTAISKLVEMGSHRQLYIELAALVRQGQGKCWWCCGMGTKNCCKKPHSTLQPRRHSVLQVSQVCSAGIQTWVHAGLWQCLNLYSES